MINYLAIIIFPRKSVDFLLENYQFYASSKSQLYENASSKAARDAIVPERGVALLVLQPHQEDLLHQRESSFLRIAVFDFFRPLVIAARRVRLPTAARFALVLSSPFALDQAFGHGVCAVLFLLLLLADGTCRKSFLYIVFCL